MYVGNKCKFFFVIILKLLLANYINGRHCILDLGYENVPRAYIASMDSILNCGDFSLQSKGKFLYFVATANSTIDSSTKTMEDGVVDSLPNCNALLVKVSSPSPLRAKSMTPACI